MRTSYALRWVAALGYVAIIYATLESIGVPIRFLRHHNLLRLSLALLYGSCFFYLISQLWRDQHRTPWRYISTTVIFSAIFFIGKSTGTPEEEIHFFEYGMVSILFARALIQHTKNWTWIMTGAFLLATLSGWIDEKIQGSLPSRHYDMKDVVMNAISSFFGLCVWGLIVCRPKENPDKISPIL